MASIQEIIDTSIYNVNQLAYLMADICKLRGVTPVNDITEDEDSLRDIVSCFRTMESSKGPYISDPSYYPSGIKILQKPAQFRGTARSYNFFMKKSTAESAEDIIPGETATCCGYDVRLNKTTNKVEYNCIESGNGDPSWITIPVFSSVSNPIGLLSNENYFVLISGYPDQNVYDITLSTDMISGYKMTNVGSKIAVSKDGTIYFIKINSSGYQVLTTIRDIYQPHKAYNDQNILPWNDAVSFKMTPRRTIAISHNNTLYDIEEFSFSDYSDPFELSTYVNGSIYIDEPVVEVKHLGFTPSMVNVTFIDEENNTMQLIATITSSGVNEMNISSKSLLNYRIHRFINTPEISEYKDMVYITHDGFILVLGNEWVGQILHYIAAGPGTGTNPYLS